MTAVPMDKYLGGSQIASQQAIQSVLAEMIAPRDEAINSAFQQLATKLQQLEAGLNQVALAAQQTKLSPFEVALKAIPFCSEDATPETAEARCYDKSFAVIERWLDAALETSEAGSGEPGTSQPEEASHAEAQEESGASCPVPEDEA
jgi:X-X-X-Leu-X-X-Gly heptad repeat protein